MGALAYGQQARSERNSGVALTSDSGANQLASVKQATALNILDGAYETTGTHEHWIERAGRTLSLSIPGAIVAWGYALQGGSSIGGASAALLTAFEIHPDSFSQVYSGPTARITDVIPGAGTRCSLLSETPAVDPRRGTGPQKFLRQVGGDDALALMSIDARGAGVLVACITKGYALTDERREIGRRIAIHLSAGLRLRQALGGQSLLDRAEAVFEADGRLAQAQGAASEPGAQSQLRDAIDRIEDARGDRKESDLVSALELWQGLVDGRWSIVRHEDTDGRRYHLAVANPPLAVIDRALTAVEAQIAAMAIASEPNKTIAYTLGIAESTAANHLSRALRKLGVRSRIELINLGVRLGYAGVSS